jgi:hypothetical protein
MGASSKPTCGARDHRARRPSTAGGSLRYLVAQRGERSPALRRVLDSLDPPRATLLVAEPFAGAVARALAPIGVALMTAGTPSDRRDRCPRAAGDLLWRAAVGR